MKKQLLIILSLFSYFLSAQNPADLDRTFVPIAGVKADYGSSTWATQFDGKIIKAGNMPGVTDDVLANRIIRLNADGTSDLSFNSGQFNFTSVVKSITIQYDGKIIVGGRFTTFNGITANGIIRLNKDGTRDTSFNAGTGFDGDVNSIVIQSDGKIIVGGGFYNYNGIAANRIIGLNTDGTRNILFNIGTGFNGGVASIFIQPDGKIMIGGYFTTFNGIVANRIIRLNTNGTKDFSFNVGTGFDSTVYSMVIQTDGKIIIVGDFTTSNGIPANRIIRLNIDGTKDSSFNVGTGFDSNGVYSIAIQTDGKIMIGGYFATFNGGSAKSILRLNTDGTRDTSFNTGSGFDGYVFSIAVQTDGKIIVGGDFSTFNGITAFGFIKLNPNGTKDISYSPIIRIGFDNKIRSMAIQNNGQIIVGGDFTTFNGGTANSIVRLNTDGTRDLFYAGTGFNLNYGQVYSVYSIAIQSDGKIIVGGDFYTFNGESAKSILRLNTDGTRDTSFNTGSGFDGYVKSIAIQPDGKIIIGGSFTHFSGISANRIIRLNIDGTNDTSFNVGTGFGNTLTASCVQSIVIQPDGKIIAGGDFTTFNRATVHTIIRLNIDGTRDSSFSINQLNNTVWSIAIQPDGKIIVGGDLQNGIIRLNTDGRRDFSFLNSGTGFNSTVQSIVIQPDGKTIVGGNFTTFNGITTNGIIRLNTDGLTDSSFNVGTGFEKMVNSIVIQPNGGLIIGGDFSKYNNVSVGNIARLNGSPVLSIDKFSRNKLLFYPNPAKDFLNLSIEDYSTPKSYEIYDLLGKNIKSEAVFQNQIDVNNLSKGLYILKVKTDTETFISKFLKE